MLIIGFKVIFKQSVMLTMPKARCVAFRGGRDPETSGPVRRQPHMMNERYLERRSHIAHDQNRKSVCCDGIQIPGLAPPEMAESAKPFLKASGLVARNTFESFNQYPKAIVIVVDKLADLYLSKLVSILKVTQDTLSYVLPPCFPIFCIAIVRPFSSYPKSYIRLARTLITSILGHGAGTLAPQNPVAPEPQNPASAAACVKSQHRENGAVRAPNHTFECK